MVSAYCCAIADISSGFGCFGLVQRRSMFQIELVNGFKRSQFLNGQVAESYSAITLCGLFNRMKLVAHVSCWLLNGLFQCSAASFLIYIGEGNISWMGGACSRKREQDNEDSLIRGLSRRYCKCGSLKWWTSSFSYPSVNFHLQKGECPPLLDLCIQKINEVLFQQKMCFRAFIF